MIKLGINFIKNTFLGFILINTLCIFAQKEFNPNKKIYIKGNSALIGNNILSVDSKKPFNENSINDINELQFIDIDDDSNTFSSSEANLNIIDDDAQIEYAALYWSAVYKYDIGEKKRKWVKKNENLNREEVYEGNDTRALDVNNILFKIPNSDYEPINGQIVFDDYNNVESYPEIKPYVCFADVTNLLKTNSNLNGTYTVANMRATEGFIEGGASGGWLLYVVYKTENAKPKYFTSYNGFIDVYRKPIDIVFNDFKSPEEGKIETSLLLGALEGDHKFKTDKCSFLNYENNTYVPIFNKVRPKLNFFNSSITVDDTVFVDRNPNSINTFGFDALKIKLPNELNNVISHDVSEATIQLYSKVDKFFLFFVAFETEITPTYIETKISEEPDIVMNTSDSGVVDNIADYSGFDATEEVVDKVVEEEGFKKIKNSKSVSVPAIDQGYYLVTNVYAKNNMALKWADYLTAKGYDIKFFVNPKNGWTYVYLKTDPDPIVIYKKQKELSKLDDFKEIWVLKVNL